MIFSAKEAIFKAIYPDIHRIVDLSSASVVCVDFMARRIVFSLDHDLGAAWKADRRIEVQFEVHDGRAVTLLSNAPAESRHIHH